MNFLDRQSAPLTEEDWERLDHAMVKTARGMLIGRRTIPVLGPLGPGVSTVPYSVYGGKTPTGIDMNGENGEVSVRAEGRQTVNLPMIYKDFKMVWRDVETDRKLGIPLDVSAAVAAANDVAVQEDDLIFNGHRDLGLEGLLGAKGRQKIKFKGWEESGNALADVVQAVGALADAGHYGPFAMVVSPKLFGRMVRVYGNTGRLELEQVKAMLTGGVYFSNVIKGDKAVVLATGSQNLELAVGQDLVTGYLGPTNLNHEFRVLETAALLIRRPAAICTIE